VGPRGIEAIRFMAGFRIRINHAKALNKVFVSCPAGCDLRDSDSIALPLNSRQIKWKTTFSLSKWRARGFSLPIVALVCLDNCIQALSEIDMASSGHVVTPPR